MNVTRQSLANILQTKGNLEHYHVPKYQREYTWGRGEWEQLFIDIEENDSGYFMGSVICVDDNEGRSPGASRIFEVVDGQQRLTTLSILLMSIYCWISDRKENSSSKDEKEKLQYELSSIREQLVYRKPTISSDEKGDCIEDKGDHKYCFLRVRPSTQGNNLNDYLHILETLDLIKGNFKSKYHGLRKLDRAYNYFYDKLPGDYEKVKEILNKLNSLQVVHISVPSSSDAFVLFETLNNRGVPLSAMDIIKNKMLASLEKRHDMKIEDAYEEWQNLLHYLPEYQDQERFLRQYYNAFKVYQEIKLENFVRATKSNLIKIYEAFIKRDAKASLDDMLEKSKTYNSFIDPDSNDLPEKKKKHLLDLGRIGSAPSYLFLLYLGHLDIRNKESVIDETLEFLVKYYVRRNITDFPNTRDLDAINMEVIEKCAANILEEQKLDSEFIIENFMNGKGKPSKIEDLKKGLEDNLFSSNAGMARFALSKICEISHTREYNPDLWARNEKGALVWTVEHILPQGENMPSCWVDMIAEGDKTKATEIQKKRVHCLGNLTLSGYNSKLSNACFEDKQKLHFNEKSLGRKRNIGFKNGLELNKFPFCVDKKKTNLAEIDKWTDKSIEARNNAMVDVLVKCFAFDEELNNQEKEKSHGNQ